MSTEHLVPEDLRNLYHVREWRNATGVLATACPNEWTDIIEVLRAFRLLRSEILTAGGGLSPISQQINAAFDGRGWKEKSFATRIVVDETEYISPTHAVDCFKGRVALELEWNNKDPCAARRRFRGRQRRQLVGVRRELVKLSPLGSGVVAVRGPGRLVCVVGLIAPHKPPAPGAACKQFEARRKATSFDDAVELVRFARVLTLASADVVHLPAPRRQCASVLAAHAEQHQFSDVAEVEPDAAPVTAAVLAQLVPDDIGLVLKAPRFHDAQAVRQQGIRHPQVQVRGAGGKLCDRQSHDRGGGQGTVTGQSPMLGCHLPGAVHESPRWVCRERLFTGRAAVRLYFAARSARPKSG